MDKCGDTPCNLKNSFQKLLVKIGYLSLTIESGKPCNLKTLFKNAYAIDFVE